MSAAALATPSLSPSGPQYTTEERAFLRSTTIPDLFNKAEALASDIERSIAAKLLSFHAGNELDFAKQFSTSYFEPPLRCNPQVTLLLTTLYQDDPRTFSRWARALLGSEVDDLDAPITPRELALFSMGSTRTHLNSERDIIEGTARLKHQLREYFGLDGFPDDLCKTLFGHSFFTALGVAFSKSNPLTTILQSDSRKSLVFPPEDPLDRIAAVEVLLKVNQLVSKLEWVHLHIVKDGNRGPLTVKLSPLLEELLGNSPGTWRTLRDQLRSYGTIEIANVADTVDEFTRLVVLPATLNSRFASGEIRGDADLSGEGMREESTLAVYSGVWVTDLRPHVFRALFCTPALSGSSEISPWTLPRILELSRLWHNSRTRNLLSDAEIGPGAHSPRWQALIEPAELTIRDGRFTGWTIKNLTTIEEINREAEDGRMGTCIDTFWTEFIRAREHVILFEDSLGQSRAYLRLSFDAANHDAHSHFGGIKGLKVEALRGRQIHNQNPDADSIGIKGHFENLLKSKVFGIRSGPFGDSRPLNERNDPGSFRQLVGFDYFDSAKRQKVFDAFCCAPGNPLEDRLSVEGNAFVTLPAESKRQMDLDHYLQHTGLAAAAAKVTSSWKI